ncbi:MAG: hypothetical protein ACI9C4_000525 [Paraglaciecola sp.]|jgi:hypothetical protein
MSPRIILSMLSSRLQRTLLERKNAFWHTCEYRASLRTALGVVVVLMAIVLLNGCAIGNVGTLASKVERSGNVSTVDMYSIGLHLRTRSDDSGAHLGYSHRQYVFDSESTLQQGWYFFKAPLPEREAVAQDLMTIGVELSIVAPVAGITLGYCHNKLHTRTPVDGSVYVQFDRINTRVVNVQYCKEDEPCKIKLPSH